jgi:plastocyanin
MAPRSAQSVHIPPSPRGAGRLLYLAALLLLAAGVASAAPPSPPATGTIEGRLVLSAERSRLARASYVVGGVARRVEPLPAVAMIVGPLPGPGSGPAADHARVMQRDTAFSPGVVVVRAGAAVAYPNEDPFFHNVFSYSRTKRFDLGRYPRGESKSVRFDSPGVVQVFCEIHGWMRSAVVVTENPYFALVAEDGSFTIPDVPAGRHKLRVWHFDRGETTREIHVPASGTVRVEVRL